MTEHQWARALVDELRDALSTMTVREPHGSFTLDRMFDRQLATIRATVEHHREFELATKQVDLTPGGGPSAGDVRLIPVRVLSVDGDYAYVWSDDGSDQLMVPLTTLIVDERRAR